MAVPAAGYLERLEKNLNLGADELDEDEVTGPGAPFDASHFFRLDTWAVWPPDPRNSTASWMAETEPELFDRYCTIDREWGLMGLDPDRIIPIES